MAKETPQKTSSRKQDDEQILKIIVHYFKLVSVLTVVWISGYFGFSITWVLAVLLVYVFHSRYNKLKVRQMGIAHEAAKDEEKSVLARVEDMPSWVFFPDVERAEWLNKTVAQLWPFIGDYTEKLLRESVEPKLKSSLPSYLKSFKFLRIDLGDMAPRIGGVKTYVDKVRRDEIVLDMEIFYAGDADIKISISKVKAGIKDIQVHGTLRVLLKPLISTMPLIGGIQVFFLTKPSINFNLTDLANAFDIPGLHDTLNTIIQDQVASILVLPNRYPIKLAKDLDIGSLKYPAPQGILRINVVSARDLRKADLSIFGQGKSDPYANIFVGSQSFNTQVVKNNINPVWNAYYEAVVDQRTGQELEIEVFDDDDANKDDNLGRLSVDIASVSDRGHMDRWLPLEEADTGQLRLRLMWLNLSPNPEDLEKAIEQCKAAHSFETLSSSLLMIYLDSASDLPKHRRSMTSEPSPFCVLKCGNDRKQSAVQNSTSKPRWEENFQFLIHSPLLEDLDIEVLDKKNNDKKIGWLSIPIKQLLSAPSMTIYEPFRLKQASASSVLSIRLCLRILTSNDVPYSNSVSEIIPSETKNKDSPTRTDNQPSSSHADNTSEKVGAFLESRNSDSSQNTPTMLEHVRNELRRRPTHSQRGSVGSGDGFGRIQVTIRYSVQRSRLIVVIHKCMNLIPCDSDNLANPYVRIYLLPDKSLHGKKKTQTVKDNLNPIFDETFEFAVNQSDAEQRSLDISCKNSVPLFSSSRTDMGKIWIDLSSIDLNKASTEWYDLQALDLDKSGRKSSSFTTAV